jgi:hypothetical protein
MPCVCSAEAESELVTRGTVCVQSTSAIVGPECSRARHVSCSNCVSENAVRTASLLLVVRGGTARFTFCDECLFSINLLPEDAPDKL